MPYIRDPDFARLIEILEATKNFSEDQNIKDHMGKGLGILKTYGG